MSDRGNNAPSREILQYSVTIRGRRWSFDGEWWRSVDYPGKRVITSGPHLSTDPAELRAIADVQDRWERDHAKPTRQVRPRVVKGVAKWMANGVAYVPFSPPDVIRPADLTAILDLRDNGAWEESLDDGATWTPTHEGPTDA